MLDVARREKETTFKEKILKPQFEFPNYTFNDNQFSFLGVLTDATKNEAIAIFLLLDKLLW